MVHFVIALFVASIILDILGWLTRKEKFHFAAWINLILAAIAVLLALFSGLWEKGRINLPSEAVQTFEIHETLAFLSASIIISLFLWRAGMKGRVLKKVKTVYLMVSLAGFCTVLSGAFYGGILVYQHAAGIRLQISQEEPSREIITPPTFPPRDNLFYPAPDSIP